MKRGIVVAAVIVAVAAWAAGAQPTGEDLLGWAHRHWADVGSANAGVVSAWFAPEGGVAFLGVPGDVFYLGADVEMGWDGFFEAVPVRGQEPVGVIRAVAAARLVYGTLELEIPGGTLTVDSFLRFRDDGGLAAADYVVRGGLGGTVPVLDGQIEDGEYPGVARDARSGVTLYWRNGLVVLFTALRSPGTGWVSVGFDPVNRMQGANYILAAVTPDGVLIEDHFGTGPTSHRRDSRNDVLSAEGSIVGGETVVEFVIPLDSHDPEDKPLVPGRTYTVLLAYHRSSTSFSTIHTARGSVQMKLED